MEEKFDVLDALGQYTGKIATRSECHQNGLWHRGVVIFIVSPDHQRVLLQKRSTTKKLWPGLWDVTSGGHVLAGEFGYQAGLRELQEEISLTLNPHDLICLGGNLSQNHAPNIKDYHYNEYYVTIQDVDPTQLRLQDTEVSALQWFSCQELASRIAHNFNGLVKKQGCFETLLRYVNLIAQASCKS